MKRTRVRMGQEPVARDQVATMMWGRVRSQAFEDRRRRKPKHRPVYEW